MHDPSKPWLVGLVTLDGGRTWWAHFAFARINIEPIILRKKIEDLREAGASLADGVLDCSIKNVFESGHYTGLLIRSFEPTRAR